MDVETYSAGNVRARSRHSKSIASEQSPKRRKACRCSRGSGCGCERKKEERPRPSLKTRHAGRRSRVERAQKKTRGAPSELSKCKGVDHTSTRGLGRCTEGEASFRSGPAIQIGYHSVQRGKSAAGRRARDLTLAGNLASRCSWCCAVGSGTERLHTNTPRAGLQRTA